MRPVTSFMSRVNFIPGDLGAYGIFFDSRQLILNVLLAVPFGFGVNFVLQPGRIGIGWLTLAFGVAIECLQLAISLTLGYAYRVIDVNDVLLNALGVLIGYVLFCVFAKVYLTVIRRVETDRLEGLASYLLEVAMASESPRTPPLGAAPSRGIGTEDR